MPALPPLPAGLQAAHTQSLSRMLAVEQAVRIRGAAGIQSAIHAARPALAAGQNKHVVVASAAQAIELSLTGTLALGRAASRRESRSTYRVEWKESLGSELPDPVNLEDPVPGDEAAAVAAAKAYAASWLANTLELIDVQDLGSNPIRSMQTAAANVGHKLDTAAATEVARSYNEERQGIEADYAEQAADRPWMILPLKIWLAEHDVKTCHRCWALNGTVQLIGIMWPDGEPGWIHLRCRCLSALSFTPLVGLIPEDDPDWHEGLDEIPIPP